MTSIPSNILQAKRPSSTIIKFQGNRYVVIKRTSIRVNGKPRPKELGVIGYIIDGKYIEKIESISKSYEVKEYGLTTLLDNISQSIISSLREVYSDEDALKIYVIALLRSAYGNVTDREFEFKYLTSFLHIECCLPRRSLLQFCTFCLFLSLSLSLWFCAVEVCSVLAHTLL